MAALAYMEKIMSNTKRTESREVRESGELTDDNLAVVVGGSKASDAQKEVKACLRDGDHAGAQAATAAFYAGHFYP
jgi:hypothetical protein